MEDKVLEMEAYSQAIAELGGTDLEAQFAALESGSNIDEELAAIKAQVLANSVSEQKQESFSPSGSAVDDELEALHKQIDNL